MMIFDPKKKKMVYKPEMSKKQVGHYDVNWIFDQHKRTRYALCRGILMMP